jgi:uncharacterized protein DUF4384
MRFRTWMLVLGLAATTTVSILAAEISFSWAFLRNSDGRIDVLDFDEGPSVQSGDQLRIILRLDRDAYVYLFLFDSSRTLCQLYPESLKDYAGAGLQEGDVVLPSADSWYTLDEDRGVERFYLIVSEAPLVALETAAVHFSANPGGIDAQSAVLDEIRRAIQQHSELAAPTERGVPIAAAVNTRSLADELAGFATAVLADGFYAKTLRLRHE